MLGAPICDRLVAVTDTAGTCNFLVFLLDCSGYVVTIALLLYHDFGPDARSAAAAAAAAAAADTDGGGGGDGGDDGTVDAADAARTTALRSFVRLVWTCGVLIVALLALALAYFQRKLRRRARGGSSRYASPGEGDAGRALGIMSEQTESPFGELQSPRSPPQHATAASSDSSFVLEEREDAAPHDEKGRILMSGESRGESPFDSRSSSSSSSSRSRGHRSVELAQLPPRRGGGREGP